MPKPVRLGLTGIHPRSEAFIQVSRDFDRGRATKQDLEAALSREVADVVRLQGDLKFDAVTDGLYRFQDLFRPFSERAKGLTVGALTRWFDNNTFYKQPVVSAAPQFDGKAIAPYAPSGTPPAGAGWKAVLPGPVTFARLAEDRYFKDEEKLVLSLASDVLNPAVRELARQGFRFVQLNEPAIVTSAAEDFGFLNEAIEAVFAGVSGPETAVHTFFGDATPYLEGLFGLEVDFVGFDLLETPGAALREFGGVEQGIIAGVVDGRNSFLEDPRDVAKTARELYDLAGDPGLVLAPNTDLEFLPLDLATRKVERLAEAREALLTEVRA